MVMMGLEIVKRRGDMETIEQLQEQIKALQKFNVLWEMIVLAQSWEQ